MARIYKLINFTTDFRLKLLIVMIHTDSHSGEITVEELNLGTKLDSK